MAKKISDKSVANLSLSQIEKERLLNLADEYGHKSLTSFVAAIANGKYKIISDDAYTLLEAIREKRAARKERYEAKKQKEEDNANR